MPGLRDDGLRDDDLTWLLGQGWNGHLPAEIAQRTRPARTVRKRIGIAGMIAVLAAVTIIAMPGRPSLRWNTGSGIARPNSSACQGAANTAGGADPWGGCWPGAQNTGVPAGTSLTAYGGSCTITTNGTVIDSKSVDCAASGGLTIQAANVTISKSDINGIVRLDTDNVSADGWSVTISDSEVDAGTEQLAVLCCGNLTATRVNLHGGITGAQCEEKSLFCYIQDSWLHGQYLPDDQPWHLGGFLSDGTRGPGCSGTWCIEHVHNTVVCDHAKNSLDEGCTGDVNLIPNFDFTRKVRVYRVLMGANADSAYCTFGGEKSTSPFDGASNVTYDDNVFQRGTTNICAAFGPVTDFDQTGSGNVWTNNRYEDGVSIPAP